MQESFDKTRFFNSGGRSSIVGVIVGKIIRYRGCEFGEWFILIYYFLSSKNFFLMSVDLIVKDILDYFIV